MDGYQVETSPKVKANIDFTSVWIDINCCVLEFFLAFYSYFEILLDKQVVRSCNV